MSTGNIIGLLAVMIAAIGLIYYLVDRRNKKRAEKAEKTPHIKVTQDDLQRRNGCIYHREDDRIFANAIFSVKNRKYIPVEISAFELAGKPLVRDSSDVVDQHSQFITKDGKCVQNRAEPCSPPLPIVLTPKAGTQVSIWADITKLALGTEDVQSLELTVVADEIYPSTFSVQVHRYHPRRACS